MTVWIELHQGEGSLMTEVMTRPQGGEEGQLVGLSEPEESLGTPAVGRLGMGMVPKGHWCRMGHLSLSFLERRAENCVKNCRTRRETDTSSIAISFGGR